jgi:hypothetical protein
MSELGQSRHFGCRLTTSGLPPTPDILSARRHVSKVPNPDIRAGLNRQRKAASAAASALVVAACAGLHGQSGVARDADTGYRIASVVLLWGGLSHAPDSGRQGSVGDDVLHDIVQDAALARPVAIEDGRYLVTQNPGQNAEEEISAAHCVQFNFRQFTSFGHDHNSLFPAAA